MKTQNSKLKIQNSKFKIQIRIILSLLIVISTINSANAQWECGTTEEIFPTTFGVNCGKLSSDYTNKYSKKEAFIPNQANSVIKYLHVNFIVIQRADGTGNFMNTPDNISRIKTMFSYVNINYQNNSMPSYTCDAGNVLTDTKIRIVLDSIYFIKDPTSDSTYYYGPTGNPNNHYANVNILTNLAYSNYPTTKHGLNYFITGGKWGTYGGYADGNGIACHSFYRRNPEMNQFPIHDWDFTFHLTHEIGHILGLNHLYQPSSQSCDSTKFDFVHDAFNNSCSSQSCNVCLIDSLNNNILGGRATWYYTSQLQAGIMHRRLIAQNHKAKNYTNGYSSIPFNITQNETWDFPIKMYQDLVVKAGSTLTIKCEVQFVKEASLIIEPGAKLIIDGGVLTNGKYDNAYWQGVQVWGTSSQHQYPDGNPTFQGYLSIINGGIIENAVNGARNWKPNDYNKIGGVIVCNEASFINNRRAVEFVTYRNWNPIRPATTRNNLSKFINTTFLVDDNQIGGNELFNFHVSMWNVKGIGFVGCDFSNLSTNKKYSTSEINRAIYSIDAGYFVNANCNSPYTPCPPTSVKPSTFIGFQTAVQSKTGSSVNTFTIDQCTFDNNLNGIKVEGINNTTITRNNFEMGGFNALSVPIYEYYKGIVSTNSSGFTLEENSITREVGSLERIFGVSIYNAGVTNNRTYRNFYYNNTVGNYVNGVNHNTSNNSSGYQVLCSTFDGFKENGIMVDNFAGSNNGIRYYQGDAVNSLATGNTFVNLLPNTFGFNNTTSTPVLYFYNGANSNPTANGSVTKINVANANTCPSNFGGSSSSSFSMANGYQLSDATATSFKSEILSKYIIYQDLMYNYNQLIDGGNTISMIQTINESWSTNAWNLRNQLITKSPYLSTEAIISALQQQILPNAMVLEVCLANPEATRGEGFIEKLQSVNQNIPSYIVDLIRANWFEESPRGTLEKSISTISYELQTLQNQVLTNELNKDSISNIDILSALSLNNQPAAYLNLILTYAEMDSITVARNLLANIPVAYSKELLFVDLDLYLDLLETLSQSNRKFSQLTESEMSVLTALTQSEGKVAIVAKNILCFFYQICYPDQSVKPYGSKNAITNSTPEKAATNVLYSMSAYPNPSSEYTSIKYNVLAELSSAYIRITSLEGKMIHSFPVKNNEGEVLIDTRKLENGIYICSLYNTGELKSTSKLIVSHE